MNLQRVSIFLATFTRVKEAVAGTANTAGGILGLSRLLFSSDNWPQNHLAINLVSLKKNVYFSVYYLPLTKNKFSNHRILLVSLGLKERFNGSS